MDRQHLYIAVADDELDMRDWYARVLTDLGHDVVVNARDGQELVDRCYATRPDLLIVDVRMPGLDGLEAAAQLSAEEPIPTIIVSAHSEPELVARAADQHILAYLIKPIKQADLIVAIALAMRRFEEFAALRRETDDLRQALEERKLIERAKGLLMRQIGLEEEAAFRRLQKLASESNHRLVDVARQLLAAEGPKTPPRH
jgi:response regulator NasT